MTITDSTAVTTTNLHRMPSKLLAVAQYKINAWNIVDKSTVTEKL